MKSTNLPILAVSNTTSSSAAQLSSSRGSELMSPSAVLVTLLHQQSTSSPGGESHPGASSITNEPGSASFHVRLDNLPGTSDGLWGTRTLGRSTRRSRASFPSAQIIRNHSPPYNLRSRARQSSNTDFPTAVRGSGFSPEVVADWLRDDLIKADSSDLGELGPPSRKRRRTLASPTLMITTSSPGHPSNHRSNTPTNLPPTGLFVTSPPPLLLATTPLTDRFQDSDASLDHMDNATNGSSSFQTLLPALATGVNTSSTGRSLRQRRSSRPPTPTIVSAVGVMETESTALVDRHTANDSVAGSILGQSDLSSGSNRGPVSSSQSSQRRLGGSQDVTNNSGHNSYYFPHNQPNFAHNLGQAHYGNQDQFNQSRYRRGIHSNRNRGSRVSEDNHNGVSGGNPRLRPNSDQHSNNSSQTGSDSFLFGSGIAGSTPFGPDALTYTFPSAPGNNQSASAAYPPSGFTYPPTMGPPPHQIQGLIGSGHPGILASGYAAVPSNGNPSQSALAAPFALTLSPWSFVHPSPAASTAQPPSQSFLSQTLRQYQHQASQASQLRHQLQTSSGQGSCHQGQQQQPQHANTLHQAHVSMGGPIGFGYHLHHFSPSELSARTVPPPYTHPQLDPSVSASRVNSGTSQNVAFDRDRHLSRRDCHTSSRSRSSIHTPATSLDSLNTGTLPTTNQNSGSAATSNQNASISASRLQVQLLARHLLTGAATGLGLHHPPGPTPGSQAGFVPASGQQQQQAFPPNVIVAAIRSAMLNITQQNYDFTSLLQYFLMHPHEQLYANGTPQIGVQGYPGATMVPPQTHPLHPHMIPPSDHQRNAAHHTHPLYAPGTAGVLPGQLGAHPHLSAAGTNMETLFHLAAQLENRRRGLTKEELDDLPTWRYRANQRDSSTEKGSKESGEKEVGDKVSDSTKLNEGDAVTCDLKAKNMLKGLGRLKAALANRRHDTEQTKCMVCLEEFEVKQTIRMLACGHEYHSKCVDRWLKNNRTCPMCRADAHDGTHQEEYF